VEIAIKAVAGVALVATGRGAAGAIAGFSLGTACAATLGLAYL